MDDVSIRYERRELESLDQSTTDYWNSTGERDLSTDTVRHNPAELLVIVSIGVAMCTVMVATLVGNGLVVAAVCSYHRLRSVTNYFVVSLAVADLTVAVLVMPYSALFELEDWTTGGSIVANGGGWRHWFGWAFCYFWISCDVTCCTSSILHLCVIAVERYLAITKPLTHAGRVSRRRALAVIGAVWTCSLAISFVPIYAGWFAANVDVVIGSSPPVVVVERDVDCALHVNRTYAVISSMTSFYLPLVVMAVVYVKIYRIARRKAGEITKLEQSIGVIRVPSSSQADDAGGVNVRRSVCSTGSAIDGHYYHHHRTFTLVASSSQADDAPGVNIRRSVCSTASAADGQHHHHHRQQPAANMRSSRDSKAVKTLGTLMGLFCICWCPFFVFYLVMPFCPSCEIPAVVVSAITWLGYGNSAVNPFVYAYLNRDFRVAYRRLISCRRYGFRSSGGDTNRSRPDVAETSWSSVAAPAAKLGGRWKCSTRLTSDMAAARATGGTPRRERLFRRVPSPLPILKKRRCQLNASPSALGQMSENIEMRSDNYLRV